MKLIDYQYRCFQMTLEINTGIDIELTLMIASQAKSDIMKQSRYFIITIIYPRSDIHILSDKQVVSLHLIMKQNLKTNYILQGFSGIPYLAHSLQ